ncbi:hypothetical protein M422DRAFT_168748 [Sphaerobolus stellatus SS14]|uniref:Elongation factor methyltransferase 6 n=1 Tax=Sphaerobolus stellatus (strain SS14) TaxID=990650 RepID=A0A0C9VPH8_SPHS4|nr:hypothetical protein M422DRAFT_168748 [Sphaerobolus stellatus SS14]
MQPAHFTKHVPLLQLPFLESQFSLTQLDNGKHNGTAVWLGGQTLALSLPFLLATKAKSKGDRPKRAIELGSGTGFTALALCSLGWDVLATDTRHVISAVLQTNIDRNRGNLPFGSGIIQVRELDWTVDPENWTWSHPSVVASQDTQPTSHSGEELLGPHFDLVLTADTVYIPELLTPLLRSLNAICRISSCPVYLALERRDSRLVDDAFRQADDTWSFSLQRIPNKKISKALLKARCKWEKSEWEGVEIWKFVLQSASEPDQADVSTSDTPSTKFLL